jgi:hypothetical protein
MLAVIAAYLVVALTSAWAVMALAIDLPFPRLRIIAAVVYGLATLVSLLLWRRLLPCLLCFVAVLVWWVTLKPSNEGQWQADVSRTAWADVRGNEVTIHNLRDCDYRTELDYSCQWLTRSVDLNQIDSLDLFMDYWGSPLIAHTILSFNVRGEPPVAFSIEARKHAGQNYSALLGFFRQFTLISVVSNERDVVRLRANYRHGEDLYLYRTTATPEFARSLFLNYLGMTNQLHDRPQWYNAITHNCTTEIYTLESMKGQPWDWRILLNGKGDEMAYEKGLIVTGGLPFKELKQRAWINPAARAANDDPDFSARIRQNRPGFPATAGFWNRPCWARPLPAPESVAAMYPSRRLRPLPARSRPSSARFGYWSGSAGC